MRLRVSRKKRKTIILSSVVITLLAILVLLWKLPSFTRSLKMDFDGVGLNCKSVTVLSDANFETAINDGTLPSELVTDELIESVTSDGAEVCLVWLDYTIASDIELDENKFSVVVHPTRTAKGKFYSHTPVGDCKNEGNIYRFSQAILIDKVDVKNFFFEKELPRPFKGSCSFELEYCIKETGKTKKVGFHTDNQL